PVAIGIGEREAARRACRARVADAFEVRVDLGRVVGLFAVVIAVVDAVTVAVEVGRADANAQRAAAARRIGRDVDVGRRAGRYARGDERRQVAEVVVAGGRREATRAIVDTDRHDRVVTAPAQARTDGPRHR